MKTLIALIATVAASSAFAGIKSTDYGCYELRAKINRNGVLIVNGKRLVPDQGMGDYCGSDRLQTIWVKTADFKNCPVNTCVARADH